MLLNTSFCAQGVAYPAYLAYFYTPYYLSYEIDYKDVSGRIIPFGNRNRIPEKVSQGIYRPNFIVGDDWSAGNYQITWKYKISAASEIVTQVNPFQVINNTESNLFVMYVCIKDISAEFNVLQEALDLPGTFSIVL